MKNVKLNQEREDEQETLEGSWMRNLNPEELENFQGAKKVGQDGPKGPSPNPRLPTPLTDRPSFPSLPLSQIRIIKFEYDFTRVGPGRSKAPTKCAPAPPAHALTHARAHARTRARTHALTPLRTHARAPRGHTRMQSRTP